MGGTITNDATAIDPATAASLLGWWLESGVDVAVAEQPRDWRRVAPVAPAPVAAKGETPGDLSAFRTWMASASGLPLDRAGARRVLPMGVEGAPVMLLADFPSAQECEAGRPMAGDAWLLATRMLAAIGIEANSAYLATLTCFDAPGARLDPAEIERCAELARDHVRLARPERLLLLGDAAAKALTGQPLGSASGHVHRVEGVRTVATFHPRWLLQRPSDKALAWKDLQLLMSEEG